MRSKFKKKIINESNNNETIINENDKDIRLNSTIANFKDINLKKIFIKKNLTINNEKIKKDKKIPINNQNNNLKLYKHVQIRKKLYPESSDLLSPKYQNNISKMENASQKPSFSQANNKTNTIILKPKKENKNLQIITENKNSSLFNTIQVNNEIYENINKTETNNNYSTSQFNSTVRNNNKASFNYIRKKVAYNGKLNNNINKNTENKINENTQINEMKSTKSAEKNKTNIISNNNNLKVKGTYLLFPNKSKDSEIFTSKTIETNKEENNKNDTFLTNNNYQITDSIIVKENNNADIYNKKIKAINEKENETDKENRKDIEKSRYIYINRKIRNKKNDYKSNENNNNNQHIENEKDNNSKLLSRPSKNIEIEVENSNSINSPTIIKENTKEDRYSLTEKKEELTKSINNFFKSRINNNLTNTVFYRHYKTKSTLGNGKPFQSLKFLVHKANEIEQLGDSFGKIYLSDSNTARNLKYNTRTHNLIKDEKNNDNFSSDNNKLMTLPNFNNTISINKNKYNQKNTYSNLISEGRNHFGKINNNYNNEHENRVINNNVFNTTVNFYKINSVSTEQRKNDLSRKNRISSGKKSSNKNYFELKRRNSDYSFSNNNISENSFKKSEKYLSKGKSMGNYSNDQIIYNDNNIREEIQDSKYEINLEILYILEAKLKCILNKVNNYIICYNECFDWINYYFSCKFYEKEINLFELNHNRNNIIYYIKVELLCYFLCYDVSFNKNFNQAGILLKTIFNLLHINFLILTSFILYGNDTDVEKEENNIDNNNDNYCYIKLREIIKEELKIKLNAQDMNENSILILISNNFKEINNYYKMIIDNLYSYYYSITDNNNTINKAKNKFPNCLSLNVNSLNSLQKLNIISLFFFDTYRLSINFNFEDLKLFFDLYLYKSNENKEIMTNNINSFNNNFYYSNNEINNYNNKYILNEQKDYNKIQISEYYLPPIKSYYKYTLVLDLDETLVYYQRDINFFNNDYNINKNASLILRPGLLEFLNKMKPLYELVLFSFGTKDYVDYILSFIEKKGKIFEYVLYRQHATYEKGDYVKNLFLLGRDLKRIIIVDDIPHVFKLQKSNGICIKPFFGDVISDRNTLKILGKILEKIRFEADENDGDIRKCLKKQRNLIFTNITTNLKN